MLSRPLRERPPAFLCAILPYSLDLADALAKGDFAAAKKALEELMDKLQKGDLTEEQKKLTAEQLEQIAKQLE